MKNKHMARRIAIAAMLTALTCVTTMIIKIPSPLKGYLNLGDSMVLLAGWTLSPLYGFLAAGLGSALADVLSGYVIYAPATFIIKGLMALICGYGYRLLCKKLGHLICYITTGIVAQTFMVLGYFVFEGCLYGFAPSLVNIPANSIQAIAGLILGCVLMKVLEKSKISFQ